MITSKHIIGFRRALEVSRLTVVKKAAVCLLMLFAPVFFIRAQERDSLRIYIHYPVNRHVIFSDFADNAASLKLLNRWLEVTAPGDIRMLSITSAASPEGPVQNNILLSLRRGVAVQKYILDRRPDLESRMVLMSLGEAWEDLYSLDPSLPDIQQDEALLRSLPKFRFIAREYFPQLRFARVDFFPQVYPVSSWESEGFVSLVSKEMLQVPERTFRPAQETVMTEKFKTIAAVKTNLLFDAVSMLNYAVEIPLGKRASVVWEHYFPWWVFAGNRVCIQYLTLGGEARWWFAPKPVPESQRFRQRDRLVGHYFGLYGFWGKTDLQWNYLGRYQCDSIVSAGITYGFSVPVTRHLNLEFSASVGYARIPYQHYIPSDDWQTLWKDLDDNGITHYFGPTKLQLSLVWPIQIRVREGAGR